MFEEISLVDAATLAGVVTLFAGLTLARRKAVREIEKLQREIAGNALSAVMRAIRTAQTDPPTAVAQQVEEDLEWVYELGVSVGASKCACGHHKAA